MVCFPLIKWSGKNVTNLQICTYLKRKNKGTHDTFCLAFFFSSSVLYDMLRKCNTTRVRKACVLNEKPSMQRKRKSKQSPYRVRKYVPYHSSLHTPFFSRHLVFPILSFPLSIIFPPFLIHYSPFLILLSLFTILHSPSFLFHSSCKSLFIPSFLIFHREQEVLHSPLIFCNCFLYCLFVNFQTSLSFLPS